MFQYMSQKNVASEKTEEKLKDIFTYIHYERMLPYEEDIMKLASYGSAVWKQTEEPDPWELLAAAVVSGAALDYVESCEANEEQMKDQLQRWFARNNYTWNFFKTLDKLVQKCKSPHDFRMLRNSIRIIR